MFGECIVLINPERLRSSRLPRKSRLWLYGRFRPNGLNSSLVVELSRPVFGVYPSGSQGLFKRPSLISASSRVALPCAGLCT